MSPAFGRESLRFYRPDGGLATRGGLGSLQRRGRLPYPPGIARMAQNLHVLPGRGY